MVTTTLDAADEVVMAATRSSVRGGGLGAAFVLPERAHVLGQLVRQLRVHAWMLRVGAASRDARELLGQLLRPALVPLGHLSGRLPIGDTGGAGISAFAPMPMADDLAMLLGAEGDGRQALTAPAMDRP